MPGFYLLEGTKLTSEPGYAFLDEVFLFRHGFLIKVEGMHSGVLHLIDSRNLPQTILVRLKHLLHTCCEWGGRRGFATQNEVS